MKVSLMLLLVVGLLVFPGNATSLAKKRRLTWIFLTTGTGGSEFTKPELEKMQGEHLENFKRLFGLKKLIAAGPLRDPGKTKRGIVVLVSTNKNEVLESFKPDPYVQNHILNVEPTTIEVQFGSIGATEIDPEGAIEENRLVIYNPQASATRDALRLHQSHLLDGQRAGLAFFATSTAKAAPFAAVALLRGTNDAAINEWVANDPLVKSGAWVATSIPQWLGKGFLGK